MPGIRFDQLHVRLLAAGEAQVIEGHFVDRANLQAAARPHAGQLRQQLDRVVQVAGLEHEAAAWLATGFDNRAGYDGDLAVLEA